MKRVILIILPVLLVLGWFVTLENTVKKPAAYKALLNKSSHYEEKELYIRAIECLNEAQTYQETEEQAIRIARDYRSLGESKEYMTRMESVCKENGYREDTVCELSDFYVQQGNNSAAIKLLESAIAQDPGREEVNRRYEAVRYTYANMYLNYEKMHTLRNGSAVVEAEGKKGLISKSGKYLINIRNTDTAPLSSDGNRVVACDEKGWFVADTKGYKREVPLDGQEVLYVGALENGIAPAKINGEWCYIKEDFSVAAKGGWEEVTVFCNSSGAVKKGGKWALIGEDFSPVTEFRFDDVIRDEYGYCTMSGRVFVKEDGQIRIVDRTGAVMGDFTCDDAKPFVGGGPAAFSRNGKWGFVDESGVEVIAPVYEDAGSFASGLAPVKKEDGWGYIDKKGQMRIAPVFDEAKSFERGFAPVKKGRNWTIIKLNTY